MLNRSVVALLTIVAAVHLGCGKQQRDDSVPTLRAQLQDSLAIAQPELRVTRLLRVSGKLKQAGDIQTAEAALQQAAKSAADASNPSQRAKALNQVALALAKAQRNGEAVKLLRSATAAMNESRDKRAQVSAASQIAFTYGRYLGNEAVAGELLENAEVAAKSIAADDERSGALGQLALARFLLNQRDAALVLLEEASAVARCITDPRKLSDALSSIASRRVRMQDIPGAQQECDAAERAALQVEDALSRGYALADLAKARRAADQPVKAEQLIDLAEKAADQVADRALAEGLREKIFASR